MLLCFVSPGVKSEPEPNSPPHIDDLKQRAELTKKIHYLLAGQKYGQLEQIAQEYRKGERTASGLWKLDFFYDGLYISGIKSRESFWNLYLGRFQQWQEKYPNSIPARIGLAEAWLDYAWYARGGGYAHTVTESGWKLFRERIEKAEQILLANQQLCSASPRWYRTMLNVAKANSWPKAKAWEVLKTSSQKFPGYFEPYFQMGTYLTPRWHGVPGEWEKMATWVKKKVGGELGDEIYARICWAVWSLIKSREFLRPSTEVSWERMKAGFEVMEKKYPTSSWNQTAFCYFAWLFKDRPATRRLLPLLNERMALRFWKKPLYLKETRLWAEETPASAPTVTP